MINSSAQLLLKGDAVRASSKIFNKYKKKHRKDFFVLAVLDCVKMKMVGSSSDFLKQLVRDKVQEDFFFFYNIRNSSRAKKKGTTKSPSKSCDCKDNRRTNTKSTKKVASVVILDIAQIVTVAVSTAVSNAVKDIVNTLNKETASLQ